MWWAEAVGDGEPQPIVRHVVELHRLTSLEAEAASHEHEGDVVQRMAVAFSQLVGPHDGRVVEHRALAARLGNRIQLAGEIGELFAKPSVDLDQLLLRIGIAIRLIKETRLPVKVLALSDRLKLFG